MAELVTAAATRVEPPVALADLEMPGLADCLLAARLHGVLCAAPRLGRHDVFPRKSAHSPDFRGGARSGLHRWGVEANESNRNRNLMSTTISMRDMLEAGVHFGHQVHRWNPKMKKFIFGQKNGIHIIDLRKTVDCLRNAIDFAAKVGRDGNRILYVGTKRQAQEIVEQQASRARQPYVVHRWLGGMLTNFQTIRTSIERIEEIEKLLAVGNVEKLVKKEVNMLERELHKLTRNVGGMRDLKRQPAAIFVIDTVKEHLAVVEARRLGIKVIALVDSNSDPALIDFPIPSNDDAIRALQLFTGAITDAFLAGSAMHKESFQREYAPQASGDVDVVKKGEIEEAEA
jgi:small subunit ribosomal protein S2